jgi:hypothetical protein
VTQVVKSIMSPDGKRRIDFFKRDDGHFDFVELRRNTRDDPKDVWSDPETWSPLPGASSICETLQIAEREAKWQIAWFERK